MLQALKYLLVACSILSFSVAAQELPFNNKPGYADSYDAGDGICRCRSNYDHGLQGTPIETPCGTKPVQEVCAEIEDMFGLGASGGQTVTWYNDIQCGHGPPNNANDETVCPGIPRGPGQYNGPRCFEKGPRWPLAEICGTEPVTLSCSESSFQSDSMNFCSADPELLSHGPDLSNESTANTRLAAVIFIVLVICFAVIKVGLEDDSY